MEKDTPLEEWDYIFKTGTIRRDRDTNITNGVLAVATPITISGSSYTLAINTKVIFDASGSRIQGKISDTQYVIKGDVFSFSAAPTFNTNGVVYYGWLASAKTVDVVDTVSALTNTFSFASNNSIRFHANGVVKYGTLATNTVATKVVDTVGDVTNTFDFAANFYYQVPL